MANDQPPPLPDTTVRPRTEQVETGAERYWQLPPAVPIATTVALVGTAVPVPLGPEGGGDGD